MVLTLSAGLFVPVGAAYVDGAGEIVRNDKGVIYHFDGIQSTTGAAGFYDYYKTGDGMMIANYKGWGDPIGAEYSNDANGNLVAKIISGTEIQLVFVSGFAYPNTNNYGAFYDIGALAIRYRVLGQRDAAGTFTFKGNGIDLSSTCALELPASDGWVETVCELTPTAEGRPFGNWKATGDTGGVVSTSLVFGNLPQGATLVVDYIGLFNTAEDARAEIIARNSISGAGRKSYANEDGQVFRFTDVRDTRANNAWEAEGGIVLYAPTDGRALSNDADGNLVMVTKSGSHWDPICFYGMTYGSAYIVEMRYKATDAASGDAVTPPAFTDETFKVAGVVPKALETTKDANGWYVTRATFDSPVQPQSGTGLTAVTFPAEDTSVVYTIDYVGFFGNEAAADANTKRARVFANDAVKLVGGQAKTDGNALRLVGVIDDYAFASYQEFGFKVSYNGKVATGKVEKYVYDSLMADGDEISIPENAVTGQGEGTKFFTWCINEIPESEFAGGKITFLVCAYAKIGDAEICGSTYRVVYDKTAQTVTATQVSA